MKNIPTFEEFLNEAANPQAKLDYFRKLGISPNNQPMTSKYALSILTPGKKFVDFSGELVDGPYYLRYKKNQRSIYTFDQVEIETGRVVKEVDIQRGNLALLRKVSGDMQYDESESEVNEYRNEEEESKRKAKNLLPLDIGTYKHGVPQVVKLLGPLYKYYKSYLDRSPSDSETRFELLAKYKEKSFPNAQIAWDIVETKGKFEL